MLEGLFQHRRRGAIEATRPQTGTTGLEVSGMPSRSHRKEEPDIWHREVEGRFYRKGSITLNELR
jgi:hypothetical protein